MQNDSFLFAEVMEYLRMRPRAQKAIGIANLVIVSASMTAYLALFVWALFTPLSIDRIVAIKRVFLVPGISFVLLSAVRALLNRPRPYEVYDFTPLIHKKTKGKSFPSRHLFSIYMISTVYLVLAFQIPEFSYIPGVVLFILGDLLGVIRMVTGVHFPKDVIVGAFVGIACGMLVLFV